jgi:hypothetical protein
VKEFCFRNDDEPRVTLKRRSDLVSLEAGNVRFKEKTSPCLSMYKVCG